ncbi:MAG: ATP synthase F0 subunit B [Acidobacteria bacterium]|nr:ATP synthase F0 subunit B [Acidobacteriota bacterium]
MKKLILFGFFVGIPVFASGNVPEGYWFEMFAKSVNAIIFFGLLFWLAKKPIVAALRSQRENLARQLEEAEQKEKDAAERLARIEERMAGLKNEVEEILKKTDAAANREKEKILEQAKMEAEKIKQIAEREIENRFRTAREELRNYMTNLAVEKAEAVLKEKMEAKDVEHTMLQYLKELEG